MRYRLSWLIAIALSGCAAPPIPDGPSLPVAIEFRTQGEPVDVATTQPASLTLTEAVRESLHHDPALQAALARLRLAMAEARQSRLLPNPVLSVVARFPTEGGDPTIEAGLTAELLSLLNRPRQINAADHRVRAAGAELLGAALDSIAQMQEQFILVQSLEAELSHLQRQREVIEGLLRIARARVEAGESSRLDVMALEAQRIRLDSERMEARQRRREERLAMLRMLGRPSGSIDWPVVPWSSSNTAVIEESALIATALEHDPQIQSRKWELQALGDEAEIARTLLNGGEVGIDAEHEEGDLSVGPAVAVGLPVFDWGQARREKASAAVVAARHELVQAQRRVIEEVRRTAAAVEANREALDMVQNDLIPLLERRHAAAEEAYRAGEADLTSTLLAEQELQEAQGRRIQLERRWMISQFRLSRAIGRPIELPDEGSTP